MSKKIDSIQAKLNKADRLADNARVAAIKAREAIGEARSAIAQLDVPPVGGKKKSAVKKAQKTGDVPPVGGVAGDVPPVGGKKAAKKGVKK